MSSAGLGTDLLRLKESIRFPSTMIAAPSIAPAHPTRLESRAIARLSDGLPIHTLHPGPFSDCDTARQRTTSPHCIYPTALAAFARRHLYCCVELGARPDSANGRRLLASL